MAHTPSIYYTGPIEVESNGSIGSSPWPTSPGNLFVGFTREISRYQPNCKPIQPSESITLDGDHFLIGLDIARNGWRCPAGDRLHRLFGGNLVTKNYAEEEVTVWL